RFRRTGRGLLILIWRGVPAWLSALRCSTPTSRRKKATASCSNSSTPGKDHISSWPPNLTGCLGTACPRRCARSATNTRAHPSLPFLPRPAPAKKRPGSRFGPRPSGGSPVKVFVAIFRSIYWQHSAGEAHGPEHHLRAVWLLGRRSGSARAPTPGGAVFVKERRRSQRFQCSGSVELQPQDGSAHMWGALTDISLHGCYVEMPTTF